MQKSYRGLTSAQRAFCCSGASGKSVAVGDRTRGFPGDVSLNTHLATWSTREGCAGCSLKCWERREGASETVRPPPAADWPQDFTFLQAACLEPRTLRRACQPPAWLERGAVMAAMSPRLSDTPSLLWSPQWSVGGGIPGSATCVRLMAGTLARE